MVAETAQNPQGQLKRPRKTVPFRLPESTRLSVRSLYVVHGLPPSQVAAAVNLTDKQVRNLIHREQWTSLRANGDKTRKDKIEAKQLARAEEDVKRTVEAVAILSEDLTLRSLNLCSEQLDAKDAKGLQMASGAARNFVQIARMSRGLDRPASGSQSQPQGNSVNLIFVGALERATPKELKQADAVNVSATAIPDSAKPSSPVNS